jgi:ABC-type Fe3+-siderophore transport system permease subunit
MTDRIPAKFRYLAAIHHLIFAILTGVIIINIIIPLAFRDNRGLNAITLVFSYMILMFAHSGILIFSSILSDLTSKIHPFVHLVSRAVTNYAFNNILLLILAITILTSLCGVYSGLADITTNVMAAIISCTEIVYFINSIVCGIFALRGYHFKNKFICPFTRGD